MAPPILPWLLLALPCVVDDTSACPAPGVEWQKVPAPGVTIGVRGAGTASATRAPWVDSNAWRFIHKPTGKFWYQLPKGKGPLAAAEAFAFGVDARLRIAPEDVPSTAAMLDFLRAVPAIAALAPAANIAVRESASPALPEVLNLLARRNLLYRIVPAPDPSADLNLRLGSPEFSETEAANPVAVADKARAMLTDRKRLLRIYGVETVIGRLYTSPDGRARLHLLNYASGPVSLVRVRVRGDFGKAQFRAFGFAAAQAEDVAMQPGAIEFTVPEMGAYAYVDLAR